MQDVAGRGSVQSHLPDVDALLLHAASHHLDNIPGLYLQGGEAPAAVDGDGAGEDRVQPLHLLPVEYAETHALRDRAAAVARCALTTRVHRGVEQTQAAGWKGSSCPPVLAESSESFRCKWTWTSLQRGWKCPDAWRYGKKLLRLSYFSRQVWTADKLISQRFQLQSVKKKNYINK